MLDFIRKLFLSKNDSSPLSESSLLVDKHGEILSDKEQAAILMLFIAFIRTSAEIKPEILNKAYLVFKENLGMTDTRPAHVLDFVTGAEVDLETVERSAKQLKDRLDSKQKQLILKTGAQLSQKTKLSKRLNESLILWLN